VKQFSHAWLAVMAIKRLENASLTDTNITNADNLIRWFKNKAVDSIARNWFRIRRRYLKREIDRQ